MLGCKKFIVTNFSCRGHILPCPPSTYPASYPPRTVWRRACAPAHRGLCHEAAAETLPAGRSPAYPRRSCRRRSAGRHFALYRPDYRLLSTAFRGMDEIYDFYYAGDELVFSRDSDRVFQASLSGFIYSFTKHPLFRASGNTYGVRLVSKFL